MLISLGVAMNDKAKEELQSQQLIFIYNASDDLISISFDFIHKIVSPSTYQCSLCKVTYGNVSMDKKWREYISSYPFNMKFLYKNNYLEHYENLEVDKFPVAYKYDGESYQLFISKEEFDLCDDLDDLIEIMNQKVNQ